jgi:CheY-like chemotaxis protein
MASGLFLQVTISGCDPTTIPMATTPTILLVDDYEDTLELWGVFLRCAGFDVLTACDGVAALSIATEMHPDLAVLDIGLPGISGADVARALRGQPGTRHMPLIAATGYCQDGQIARARSSGFDALLIKPCDPALLKSEIERLLLSRTARAFAVDGKADASQR